MKSIVWAAIASASPMGQQRYEREIQSAILALHLPDMKFELARMASLKAPLREVRRFPAGMSSRAGFVAAAAIGQCVYRTRGIVHRFDLRLPPVRRRDVVTVHDLPPLRFGDEGRLPGHALVSARRAEAVIVPSSFAASEIVELLGVPEERVSVVPYGLSSEFIEGVPASDRLLKELGVRVPFVLHAAGATDRKNLQALAEGWRMIASDYSPVSLVLAGPPDPRRDKAFEGVPEVQMTGRIESEVVASLMRRASAVVVPSTYEGFGLPALEGMACGVPVVASNRGALPEVCGDGGLLVEPSAEGLAEGIARVLSDTELRGQMRCRGHMRARAFSWRVAAQRHVEVYRRVLCD